MNSIKYHKTKYIYFSIFKIMDTKISVMVAASAKSTTIMEVGDDFYFNTSSVQTRRDNIDDMVTQSKNLSMEQMKAKNF